MTDIDYRVRPAKHVERLMLVQALRRLWPFGSVRSYRYIGFGGYYFRDFKLFHRELGIEDMLSIERDTHRKARYDFNKPFTCVEMAYETASEALPKLHWDVRTILWLDYTDSINTDAIADIALFAANAVPGSALIVTVNAQANTHASDPVRAMAEAVGETNVPLGTDKKALAGWGTAEVSRRIIDNAVREALTSRNGGRRPSAAIEYQQLFNFQYADDAKMTTVGGVLLERGQRALLASADFDELAFVRTGSDPMRIEVPLLTFKELQYLQSGVPPKVSAHADEYGIPATDIRRYHEVYRYFPVFASMDS